MAMGDARERFAMLGRGTSILEVWVTEEEKEAERFLRKHTNITGCIKFKDERRPTQIIKDFASINLSSNKVMEQADGAHFAFIYYPVNSSTIEQAFVDYFSKLAETKKI